MFSVFPSLLSLMLIAPFLLRIVAGIYFIKFGLRGLRSEWPEKLRLYTTFHLKPASVFAGIICVSEIVGGILLITGTFTQPTALYLSLLALLSIGIKKKDPTLLRPSTDVYVLLFFILFSLLFLGAGILAIDLPL